MPKPKPKPKPRPKPKPSTYRVPIVCAFIALALLCAFSRAPARTGDFTCINPNQIRSYYLGTIGASFTVPAGKTFIITDIVGNVMTGGSNIAVLRNGNIVVSIPRTNTGTTPWPVPSLHFTTGIVCPENSVITMSGTPSHTACITGYEF